MKMHSGEQERAKELITVTTVGTASQSGTFLLSWIHFQVQGPGRPHSLRLEMIMERHMRTFKMFLEKSLPLRRYRCGDDFQIRHSFERSHKLPH